jgi:predicted O-methyltransferase YrrM
MKNLYRLLDLTKIIINEIIDYGASYFGVKKFKVDIVENLALKNANKNNPQAILDTIDYYAWNEAFLMNIGDEKGLLLEKIVSHSGLSNRWKPMKGKSKDVIPSLKEKYDFVFLDHWKDEYLSDLKTIQRQGLLNDKAVIFADNVVLFNMEDYLSYVRNSSTFESKFISTMREYSKTQPDGIEISIFNKDD